MSESGVKVRGGRSGGHGRPGLSATSPSIAIEAGPAPEIVDVPAEAPAEVADVPSQPEAPSELTAPELFRQFFDLLSGDSPMAQSVELKKIVSKLLQLTLKKHEVSAKYNWLIIHDPLAMTRADADRIYNAISKFEGKRNIGLIVTSGGGQIEPAYLISKLCRESALDKFAAVVPRRAKSGATLICCGADEIHMGQMSELGPIDPQIDEFPALGLKNAVQHLAELAAQFPKASVMLAKYLSESLQLVNLGYYERVAESAVQYAERLLHKRKGPLKGKPEEVAKHLVYGYKDHGFVIDRAEAETIFGDQMMKSGTREYALGNAVYDLLGVIERTCETAGYNFYFYGTSDSQCNFVRKSK
jgi:hypothetical protein